MNGLDFKERQELLFSKNSLMILNVYHKFLCGKLYKPSLNEH